MIGIVPSTANEPALTDAACRAYYRTLAAGVAVVTACGAAGWSGATVSTLTSVSMDPPIVLCCLSRRSRTLSAIGHARRFAVHLLADDQEDLADRFSRPGDDGSLFEELGYDLGLVHGAPVISPVLAVGWCDLHGMDGVGDHSVVYGRLSAVRVGHGRPLLWHARAYQTLGAQQTSLRAVA